MSKSHALSTHSFHSDILPTQTLRLYNHIFSDSQPFSHKSALSVKCTHADFRQLMLAVFLRESTIMEYISLSHFTDFFTDKCAVTQKQTEQTLYCDQKPAKSDNQSLNRNRGWYESPSGCNVRPHFCYPPLPFM